MTLSIVIANALFYLFVGSIDSKVSHREENSVDVSVTAKSKLQSM